MRFDRVGHFTRIPVSLGGARYRLLFDTGIGVNVISTEVTERLGLTSVGESFAGQRMSGQWIEAPLVYLPPVSVGDCILVDQVAAVVDLDQQGGGAAFAGILGLTAFADTPITVDPGTQTIELGVSGDAEFRVPLDVQRRGPSTTPFAELVLPHGDWVKVEVDTGSDCLILDTDLLRRGAVTPRGELQTVDGTDETGYRWQRRTGLIEGSVFLAAAPRSRQEEPRVLFQDIVHDGLIGSDYLDRFRYTVDVKRAQLLLTPRTLGERPRKSSYAILGSCHEVRSGRSAQR